MKIVECVPNFSEGRNPEVIDAIGQAIRSRSGVSLLDVDPGQATNRTVYTFAGPPEEVLEAAFQAIRVGTELIDMREQKGAHARQGACDVCPFVPVSEITMEECVKLARRLGERVAKELSIPIFLYAEAATMPSRRRLPDIREGEYEALASKLGKPEWKPDIGEAVFNAKSGATAVGARPFLIAYNINLNSQSVRLAKEIAFTIRETGRLKRDQDGNKVVGPDGKPERVPGIFQNLQGTGWIIPEYNRAQVTVNILDLDTTPLHQVFDACCELATKLGCRVTGSEIVGMVPKRVLLEAGRHYLVRQNASQGVAEDEIIRTAIISLGLSDVAPFDPSQKIIEERFSAPAPLAAMSVQDFLKELSSNSPAPGGGSVAALAGALSTALSSMVAALTYEKKGFEAARKAMEEIGMEAHQHLKAHRETIDADTEAFQRVMDALSLPKKTDEQKGMRSAALEEANKGATQEPLGTLERSLAAIKLAKRALEDGNPNSLSDAGVAVLMARAAGLGAYYNVLINLKGISDQAWAERTRGRAQGWVQELLEESSRLEQQLLERLIS